MYQGSLRNAFRTVAELGSKDAGIDRFDTLCPPPLKVIVLVMAAFHQYLSGLSENGPLNPFALEIPILWGSGESPREAAAFRC